MRCVKYEKTQRGGEEVSWGLRRRREKQEKEVKEKLALARHGRGSSTLQADNQTHDTAKKIATRREKKDHKD